MQHWRRWIAVLAIVTGSVGLAACGDDEPDNPADPDGAEEVEEQLDDMEEEVRENTP